MNEQSNDFLIADSLFSQLINSVQQGVIIYDRDLRYRMWSPFMEKISEVPSEDVIGKRPLEIFPFLEKSGLIERLESILNNETAETLELYHESAKTKTGIWTSCEFYPHKNNNAETTGVIGIVRDITESKRIAAYRDMGTEILYILNEPEDLKPSIERILTLLKSTTGFDAVAIRFQEGDDFPYFAYEGFSDEFIQLENSLIERSEDGGICLDKDGNISLECTCGLVVTGKTDPNNPIFTPRGSCCLNDTLPLLDLRPEDDPRHNSRNNCIHQNYATVVLVPIRSNEKIVGLIQLNDKRKNNASYDLVMILEEIASHIGSALTRKQTETLLKESEHRYKHLFNEAMDGIFLMEVSGAEPLTVNESFAKMHGYANAKEMESIRLSDLDTSETARHVPERIARIMSGETISFEAEHYHKDGHTFPLAVTTNLIHINNKPYVIAFHKDITEKKKYEEAQRLYQDQEKFAVVGKLASGIAHDFNNILGIIMGYAHLLLKSNLPDDEKAKLAAIVESAMRGRDLTRNLTLFAKDQELSLERFNLNDKIDLIIDWMKPDLDNVELTVNRGSGVEEMIADAGLMENALINMIQNSIHAMSKTEKPKLTISTHVKNENVIIEIEDNGCGIPHEAREDIYAPFFSLKGSGDHTRAYKPDIEGSGYGLANVKKWIDKHKGSISHESEVGKGTKFIIKLPLVCGHLKNEEIKTTSRNDFVKGKRILVVDDEPHFCAILCSLLEELSHNVDLAVNGEDALKRIQDNQYDIISLDYKLPDMDGIEVYKKIRESNSNVPVIFVSGNFQFLQSMTDLKLNDPKVDHLAKPFKSAEYVNKINNMLTPDNV